MTTHAAEPSAAATTTHSPSRDTLFFRNGDVFYGALESIDRTNGLRWRHPDVEEPITFRLENVTDLRLSDISPAQPAASPTCLLRLTNEDELSGKLLSIDAEKVVLDTSFAGALTVPRRMIQLIQPKSPPPPPRYEGPSGLEGWTSSKVTSPIGEGGEWQYHNGAFYSSRMASIARDLKLPDTASIEFDLAWRGSFDLAVALYTDYLHPIALASKETGPDFGGFYSLRLSSYYANIMPVTKLDPLRYLGQVSLQPMFDQKSSAHIELRVNKAKNLIALLVDGVMAKTWIDTTTFAGQGTGLRLVHQGQGATKISRLRVREWDGQFEEPPTNPPDSRQDWAKLRNGDKIAGAVESIRADKLVISVAGRSMEVPLDRVKQIELAGARAERPKFSRPPVRATFGRGGTVSFELERYDGRGFAAQSPAFGKAVFDRAAFSRIEFDPKDKMPPTSLKPN